jgi:hypothetical protein
VPNKRPQITLNISKAKALKLFRYILILTILFAISPNSFAEKSQRKTRSKSTKIKRKKTKKLPIGEQKIDKFHPHITSKASTLKQYKVAFGTLPGLSGYSSISYNSLSFGLIDRLQLGTSPLVYLIDEHHYNFNLKWNFYRGQKINWALSYSTFQFKKDQGVTVYKKDGSPTIIDRYSFNALGIIINAFPEADRFRVGFSFSIFDYKTGDEALNKELENVKRPMEMMLDFDAHLIKNLRLTFGIGRTRSGPFDAFKSKLPFGFGTTFTWLKKQGILQPIAIGAHYIPTTKDITPLLSVGIDLH